MLITKYLEFWYGTCITRDMRAPSNRRASFLCRSAVLLLSTSVAGLSDTASTTQDLSVQIAPLGSVSSPASFSLTTAGSKFFNYSASVAVNYQFRTTASGAGSITMQVMSDFSPGGGPLVSSGALTYTCSGATLGTSCSGIQTASGSSQTPVLTVPGGVCTGGGGACSSADPNQMYLQFNLRNDASYKTGTYSAMVTYTISAT